MPNVDKYIAAGLQVVEYGFRSSEGYMLGAATSLANAADSAMVTIDGPQNLSLQPADFRLVPVSGNDGSLGTFIFPPEASPQGTLALGTFNAALAAKSLGNLLYADGNRDWAPIGPSDYDFKSMMLVVNSRAQSRDLASLGNPGFIVQIYPNVQLVPRFASQMANAAAAEWTHQVIANPSSKLPDGRALALADQGTRQAVGFQAYSPNLWTYHTFRKDGIDTTFTLAHLPVTADGSATRAANQGVLAAYTSAYTVSTSTGVVTLAAVGTAGDYFTIGYEYSATGN